MAFMVRVGEGADASAAKTKQSADEALQMPLWWRGPPASSPLVAVCETGTANARDDTKEVRHLEEGDASRRAVIVTTAAPPWYTGTSLNALHRAKALARQGWQVQLLFPWLTPDDQVAVYPAGLRFSSTREQADWIGQSFETGTVHVRFYPARWRPRWRSIFPAGALAQHLPPCELLILEEPEHLALFQPWIKIKQQTHAATVLGILHTNYSFYLGASAPWLRQAWIQAAISGYLSQLARRNCDQVIRLSEAVQGPAEALVAAVNGVDARYLAPGTQEDSEGLYFIGKLIWEKGWREMIELLGKTSGKTLHVFGSGEAACVDAIQELAASHSVTLVMHGPSHVPWEDLRPFKTFVNCSRSEVLCTSTAEALAMGKFALIPRHPSNAFFEEHPNCLVYESPSEFSRLLMFAMEAPLRPSPVAQVFSWEAATDRLLEVMKIKSSKPSGFRHLTRRSHP
jgi:digalactosyldiacylglycerol synthase